MLYVLGMARLRKYRIILAMSISIPALSAINQIYTVNGILSACRMAI